VITDALAIPGAQEIADYMAQALDELEAAIQTVAKPTARKKTARRKTPARSR